MSSWLQYLMELCVHRITGNRPIYRYATVATVADLRCHVLGLSRANPHEAYYFELKLEPRPKGTTTFYPISPFSSLPSISPIAVTTICSRPPHSPLSDLRARPRIEEFLAREVVYSFVVLSKIDDKNFVLRLATMMVDSGLALERGAADNVSPEKDHEVNSNYASGRWKSVDARWQCGYASFKGKRPSMEDNYDHKSAEIDGKLIGLFGIFDGHGGSRASEYLKEHLFNNLTKHPLLMVDTKIAISETFKRTDSEFLASESNTTRDDGSTASTAVLIDKQLYVANVGDSRAVICKAGKGDL
ncbi:hypothetical protein ZIOFF_025295 [Zingiber officinale]|uniref:protein-serine/threonine phosphatase n=1 Tax=Zingiber officinale TaxID=94328 RepID=A0A8J5L6S4_ZINOF|nr:hypothetical protein ZIOFF_025295 [Zingiber officinale]